jgi:hypothetical protein
MRHHRQTTVTVWLMAGQDLPGWFDRQKDDR